MAKLIWLLVGAFASSAVWYSYDLAHPQKRIETVEQQLYRDKLKPVDEKLAAGQTQQALQEYATARVEQQTAETLINNPPQPMCPSGKVVNEANGHVHFGISDCQPRQVIYDIFSPRLKFQERRYRLYFYNAHRWGVSFINLQKYYPTYLASLKFAVEQDNFSEAIDNGDGTYTFRGEVAMTLPSKESSDKFAANLISFDVVSNRTEALE